MQNSAGFVPYLLKAQRSIAGLLGVDIMYSDKTTYEINLTQLVLTSMVMKAAQTAAPAVLTDAVWQQLLSVSIDTGPAGDRSGWPGWVILQVRPEDLATFGATEADNVPTLQAKIDAYSAAQQALQGKAAH